MSASEVSGRKIEFDYLRTFTILIVLLDHAILAYTKFAFINPDNPLANSSPVVNGQRWIGFDLLVALNETFFMPLLFFISGLFVWQNLSKKGSSRFLTDRLKRLGIPFVLGVVFLIPLAYYPALLQRGLTTGIQTGYGTFWLAMAKSGFEIPGPLWFLWLLLAFNCLAALLYRFSPSSESIIRRPLTNIFDQPALFFGALLAISTAVYLPVVLISGPLNWIGIGPFKAQASRILLYLVYFLAGTMAGACGFDSRIFKAEGSLARRWWVWLSVGLISFIIFIIMLVVISDTKRTVISETAFAVCCWAFVFGLIGLFLRIVKHRTGVLDNLSRNGYGIYIVHYVYITWFQYMLLRVPLHPVIKGIMVFAGTLIFSWGTVIAVRRIPAVSKII